LKLIQEFDHFGYKLYFYSDETLFVKKITKSQERIDIYTSKSGNAVFDYYKLLAQYAGEISNDELSIERL